MANKKNKFLLQLKELENKLSKEQKEEIRILESLKKRFGRWLFWIELVIFI